MCLKKNHVKGVYMNEQGNEQGNDMLTLTEVAQRLQVARQTVSAYVHSGRLGAVKIGRRWFFTQKDLQGFMNTRSNWNAAHTGGRPVGTTRLVKAQRLVDAKECVNECRVAGFVDKDSISIADGAIVFALQDKLDKVQETTWCAYVTMFTKHAGAWATYLKAPIRQKVAVIGGSDKHNLVVRELQISTMTWKTETDEEPPATLKDTKDDTPNP